jgi:peroxiredoxin Q/BCP
MPLLAPGTTAPNFTLPDQAGKAISLHDFAGSPVVLYFYPKADTPGCTMQACGLSEALPRMNQLGAVVIGVSPDGTKALAKFATKFNLRFPLVGDEPASNGTPRMIDAYGCWGEKSMYGRKYFGVLRTTYIVDAAGVIYHRMDAVKVDTHAADVAAALADLLSGKPAPAGTAPSNGSAAKAVKAASVKKPTAKPAKPAGKAPAKKSGKKVAKAAPGKKPAKKPSKKVAKKAVAKAQARSATKKKVTKKKR